MGKSNNNQENNVDNNKENNMKNQSKVDYATIIPAEGLRPRTRLQFLGKALAKGALAAASFGGAMYAADKMTDSMKLDEKGNRVKGQTMTPTDYAKTGAGFVGYFACVTAGTFSVISSLGDAHSTVFLPKEAEKSEGSASEDAA